MFVDQLHRTITLAKAPERIISLVPSQTELLYTLGLDKEVVGITKFCIHPDSWFRTKTRVGGTKKINADVIRQLSPDLIIANKEENTADDVKALMEEYPVWVSNVQTLEDACDMMTGIGAITRRTTAASQLVKEVRQRFAALEPPAAPVPTAYLIWRDPWMAAGGDTFIHQMLHYCGLQNIFADTPRYPVVDADMLAASPCRLVLLSSEPYPFREKHIAEIQAMLPEALVLLVDGELFSWYGSRLLEAPAYFQSILQQVEVLR